MSMGNPRRVDTVYGWETQDGVAGPGCGTAKLAYDVEGHMTTPARPHGADPARDRSPARAGRRRRLRTVLTVVVAVCAAVVASVGGRRLVRSAGCGEAV